ncbi:MAG: hypothetical protein NHB32_04495 [Fischerella sp. CENA71]|nr:hypothetical protein [Fischerella sp. CENA71]
MNKLSLLYMRNFTKSLHTEAIANACNHSSLHWKNWLCAMHSSKSVALSGI